MSITFNSTGGFLNGTISSSGNNIFIQTSGSAGAIHLGTQLELTGSKVIEKDGDGNKRKETTYNTGGKITEQKFDENGKATEATVKDPTSGKESKVSGSATSGADTNTIIFEQNDNGAFISVSGSVAGFNIINAPRKSFRLIRETSDTFIDVSNPQFNLWTNGVLQNNITYDATKVYSGSFVFSPHSSFAKPALIISSSGDVRIPGRLFAQEYHTEFVSASILLTSGSTVFGNSFDDTHTFTGTIVNAITASGEISSSGTLISNEIDVRGHITASGDISGSSTTNITIGGDLTCDDVIADDLTGTLQTGIQSNITRVGTLTHGTWNATTIEMAKVKQLDVNHFAYYISSTGNGDTKYFIPLNSLSENTTGNPFNRFFAPYDGVFKKVLFNARDNNPGDVEVFFHTGSAASSPISAVQSITIGSTVDDTAYEANFSASICKVNKGDFYSVAIQGTNEVVNYWGGTWAIEYDTST